MQHVRMPSNAALVTGYAVACCRRDTYATYAVKTPAAALRQLACCNTLASKVARQKYRLRQPADIPGASGVHKDNTSSHPNGPSASASTEQPCQTQTGEGKAKRIRRPGIPSSTSSKRICRRVG